MKSPVKNTRKSKVEIVAILHDIRSVHNVGSMFRTSDAAGLSKIYLTGYTPTPLDRFGRKRADFAKCSLGAEDSVPWESGKKIGGVISKLKKERFVILALEQDATSVALSSLSGSKKIALIVGNEVGGVPSRFLKECDSVVEIPMYGAKESLNVAVAYGIALYSLLRI